MKSRSTRKVKQKKIMKAKKNRVMKAKRNKKLKTVSVKRKKENDTDNNYKLIMERLQKEIDRSKKDAMIASAFKDLKNCCVYLKKIDVKFEKNRLKEQSEHSNISETKNNATNQNESKNLEVKELKNCKFFATSSEDRAKSSKGYGPDTSFDIKSCTDRQATSFEGKQKSKESCKTDGKLIMDFAQMEHGAIAPIQENERRNELPIELSSDDSDADDSVDNTNKSYENLIKNFPLVSDSLRCDKDYNLKSFVDMRYIVPYFNSDPKMCVTSHSKEIPPSEEPAPGDEELDLGFREVSLFNMSQTELGSDSYSQCASKLKQSMEVQYSSNNAEQCLNICNPKTVETDQSPNSSDSDQNSHERPISTNYHKYEKKQFSALSNQNQVNSEFGEDSEEVIDNLTNITNNSDYCKSPEDLNSIDCNEKSHGSLSSDQKQMNSASEADHNFSNIENVPESINICSNSKDCNCVYCEFCEGLSPSDFDQKSHENLSLSDQNPFSSEFDDDDDFSNQTEPELTDICHASSKDCNCVYCNFCEGLSPTDFDQKSHEDLSLCDQNLLNSDDDDDNFSNKETMPEFDIHSDSSNTDNSDYFCNHCSEFFSNLDENWNHTCHGKSTKGFICIYCEKIFATYNELNSHKIWHLNN